MNNDVSGLNNGDFIVHPDGSDIEENIISGGWVETSTSDVRNICFNDVNFREDDIDATQILLELNPTFSEMDIEEQTHCLVFFKNIFRDMIGFYQKNAALAGAYVAMSKQKSSICSCSPDTVMYAGGCQCSEKQAERNYKKVLSTFPGDLEKYFSPMFNKEDKGV